MKIRQPYSNSDNQLTTNKIGIFLRPFHFQNSISRHKCDLRQVNHRFEWSRSYDTIIFEDLHGQLGMIINFHDQVVTWGTETIPMKDRWDIELYHQKRHD
jgi:hypothetical protein